MESSSRERVLFAGLLQRLGLAGVNGRIYGALATAARPLTMNEIARLTGDSLSSVSTHVRSLARLNLVRRMRRGKVFVHEAAADAVEFFRAQIRLALRAEIEPLEREVARRLPRVRSKSRRAELESLLDQIRRTKSYLLTVSEVSLPARRSVA